jgi:hypothetical protein
VAESGGLENRLYALFKPNKNRQILFPIIGLDGLPVHLISRLFIRLQRSLGQFGDSDAKKRPLAQSVTISGRSPRH